MLIRQQRAHFTMQKTCLKNDSDLKQTVFKAHRQHEKPLYLWGGAEGFRTVAQAASMSLEESLGL